MFNETDECGGSRQLTTKGSLRFFSHQQKGYKYSLLTDSGWHGGYEMNGIAVKAGSRPHQFGFDEFDEITGIECIENCGVHYWLYMPTELVNPENIEAFRYHARTVCRDEHHPAHIHPERFEIRIS